MVEIGVISQDPVVWEDGGGNSPSYPILIPVVSLFPIPRMSGDQWTAAFL